MESGAPGQPVAAAEAVVRGRYRVPFWRDPEFDLSLAVETMGTISAPVLAGFSLSTFVLALTLKARDTRYPGLAALLLLLAAVLLILAVQATTTARGWSRHARQPGRGKPSADQERLTAKFTHWSIGATIAYDLGLLCLLAGLTVLAVPPVRENPATRWAAVAVGAIAFTVTLSWAVIAFSAAFWPQRPAATPEEAVTTAEA